jgi:hypothetical protein
MRSEVQEQAEGNDCSPERMRFTGIGWSVWSLFSIPLCPLLNSRSCFGEVFSDFSLVISLTVSLRFLPVLRITYGVRYRLGNRDSLLVDKGRNEMNLGPVLSRGRIKKALDCRELFVRYKTVATINATAI